jgi:hypothetical protein
LASVEVSCEYLTSDKSCMAVSENEKAKAVRQIRCLNEEKLTCCYLCAVRQTCELSCSFLGTMGKESPKAADAKSEEDKREVSITEGTVSVSCSSCKAVMHEGKTKLRISGWDDLEQKPAGEDWEESEKEWLPVTVYLCPQCGKMELARRKNKNS